MSKTTKSNKAISSDLLITQSELNKLAHEGTKEAIAKIKSYIEVEKDYNKKAYAEMALEECELFYYQPQNEKEERDFTLCRIINEYKAKIDDLETEIDKIKAYLEKFELEQTVHIQVLVENKKKKEDWKYYCSEDFVCGERTRLAEIVDDLEYKKAWIESAKKMIVSKRYIDGIPERHLSHFDFNDLYDDDGSCDCCDDGTCPDCGSSHIENVPF